MTRTAICLVMCLGLPAVEPALVDVRLFAESRPTDYRFTWHSTLGERSGEDSLDQSWSLGVGWRWAATRAGRRTGLLLGTEIVGQYDSLPGGDRSAVALRGESGLAVGLHNRLVLTAAPLAGLGVGRWAIAEGAMPAASMASVQVEAGARLGLRWSVDPELSVGLDAGWLWARERAEGEDRRLDLSRSGATIALSLGWTFDPVTRRLE